LAIYPTEWRRIGRKPTLVSWFDASEALASGAFDYLLTSEFSLQFATDAQQWADYRERWLGDVARFPIAAEFGSAACPVSPRAWRTNDQRIQILRGH
jgi:hypothetical protein